MGGKKANTTKKAKKPSPTTSPTSAIKKSTIAKIQKIRPRSRASSEDNPVLRLSVLKNTAINSFSYEEKPTEEDILARMKLLKLRAERQAKIAKLQKLQMMFGMLGDEDEDEFEEEEEEEEDDEDFAPRPSTSDLLDQFANDDDDEDDDEDDYEPSVNEESAEDHIIRE